MQGIHCTEHTRKCRVIIDRSYTHRFKMNQVLNSSSNSLEDAELRAHDPNSPSRTFLKGEKYELLSILIIIWNVRIVHTKSLKSLSPSLLSFGWTCECLCCEHSSQNVITGCMLVYSVNWETHFQKFCTSEPPAIVLYCKHRRIYSTMQRECRDDRNDVSIF